MESEEQNTVAVLPPAILEALRNHTQVKWYGKVQNSVQRERDQTRLLLDMITDFKSRTKCKEDQTSQFLEMLAGMECRVRKIREDEELRREEYAESMEAELKLYESIELPVSDMSQASPNEVRVGEVFPLDEAEVTPPTDEIHALPPVASSPAAIDISTLLLDRETFHDAVEFIDKEDATKILGNKVVATCNSVFDLCASKYYIFVSNNYFWESADGSLPQIKRVFRHSRVKSYSADKTGIYVDFGDGSGSLGRAWKIYDKLRSIPGGPLYGDGIYPRDFSMIVRAPGHVEISRYVPEGDRPSRADPPALDLRRYRDR